MAARKVLTPLTIPASVTGAAPLTIPHGTAPSAPVDGDVWTTSAGVYARINGVTVGPLGTGGGGGVTLSDTPPGSPTAGQLWYDTTTLLLSIYYDSQWVEVGQGSGAVVGGGGGALDPTTGASGQVYGTDGTTASWVNGFSRTGISGFASVDVNAAGANALMEANDGGAIGASVNVQATGTVTVDTGDGTDTTNLTMYPDGEATLTSSGDVIIAGATFTEIGTGGSITKLNGATFQVNGSAWDPLAGGGTDIPLLWFHD